MKKQTALTLLTIIAWRCAQAAFVAFFVGILCFFAAQGLGGNIAYRIAGGRYGIDLMDSSTADIVAHELGLDRSLWVQLSAWLSDSLAFNFGNSLVSGTPVVDEISHTLGHSLTLAGSSIVLSVFIALPLGILAAKRPNSWFDKLLLLISVSLKSVPNFVIGILLVMLFAVQLKLLPAAGHGGLSYLILPTLTLALGLAAVSVQVVRDSTLGVRNSSYFLFSRIKGLSDTQTFQRHGWRNLLVPVVAFLGIQFITIVEGVVIIETLFAWPGIGHSLVHAIFARDIPVVQGAAVAMGLIFVAMNALVDIAVLLLDPRKGGEA
jgi:peptide/nickel transport system permease protein